MLRLLKKLRRNERGNVLILAGLAIPMIIGSAGLAVDTIQWTLWKRQLQRTADSAALAGVYARVQANASQTALQAVTNDIGKHQTTGLNLSGTPAVTFPTSAQWANGVRVAIAVEQVPAFSSMFLPTIRVPATATAATIRTGVYCVVSLVSTGATGITATGSGDINLGCGMITNSTSITAAIATGSSDVFASPVAAVGAVPQSNNWNGAELLPFTVQQDDPYAGLNPPSVTPCKGPANKLNVANNAVVDRSVADTLAGTVCVSDMSVNGTLKLGSATYFIDGGNFDLGSNANISCTGCTIILGNSDISQTANIGSLTMNALAKSVMTAPSSGAFKDILFYQDRRATTSASSVNRVNGTSSSIFSGAMYFPKQHLSVNGNAGLTFTCAEFVSWTVEFSGNSGITNTCPGGYGDDAIMGRHVRLVA